MNRLKKWAEHEYSRKQRIIAVVFGGVIFWIVIPFLIVIGSSLIDSWLSLSGFHFGSINVWAGMFCMAIGWLLANWTVKVQYSSGRGTPIPLMPTQRLVVKGPYAFCRNPMTLGTALFYTGIAIWTGSLSAL
jgi:protein-S-isoprenylcysteine O-methyltransferase Ste14